MSENSKIEWTDHTFNPWIGCQKVGPGCDHCYAESMMADRLKKVQWGPGAERVRTSPTNWRAPLTWNASHGEFFAKHGRRQRVFCASLADVFDNAVDPQWRIDLFRLIEATPNLDWLLLTKRIGNARTMSQQAMGMIGAIHKELPQNIWLGATITSQAEADRDIPKLLSVPARVHFLSMEPLLGPVDLLATPAGDILCRCDGCMTMTPTTRLDWVIVGGESGPDARPMHPNWALSLRDQCIAAGVPLLFKQWGEWVPRSNCYHRFEDGQSCSDIDPSCKRWPYVTRLTEAGHDGSRLENVDGGDDAYMQKVGKAFAGRLLDGVRHDGFPK